MKAVAFIPARSGSKRVPHKNLRKLGDHPLLAYSIQAAINSGVFDRVVCATDNEDYADVARHYGAFVPALRPTTISGDKSPDIEWVLWALKTLSDQGLKFDAFSILRPTSPFRRPYTIQQAWKKFTSIQGADSLRAIEKCAQHPGKMWVLENELMVPLMPYKIGETPWHSSQYAALPEIYVQNASLEIAWTQTALEKNSIAGEAIIPFISEGFDGFDINTTEDWILGEYYLKNNIAQLPEVGPQPYFGKLERG